MSQAPRTLGVVGAGTMGAGIAQLGCVAGMRTLLHDPVPEALARGLERVRLGLGKWVERGRAGADALDLLEPAGSLEALAPCELVIEAAPERAELKRELFARLSAVCAEDVVLATNTSSIPVTSLASAAARPENAVGMHFFNPAPLMELLELIPAEQTSERALAVARAAGEAMGKRVIEASDGPGFLVNRCGRPFGTEGLRLLQERVATHEQIDRICRLGGGFRMGPFELMDLVGVDVGYEVAKSFTELSFGEPRWKPSPIQARMVAAGRLGRKSGRGYYDYSADPYRPDDPEPPAPGGGEGREVAIEGDGRLARELRERAAAAGFAVSEGAARSNAELLVDARAQCRRPASEPTTTAAMKEKPSGHTTGRGAGRSRPRTISRTVAEPPPTSAETAATAADTPADTSKAPSSTYPARTASSPPQLLLCAASSLAALGEPTACGFHLLPPLEHTRLVELTRLPTTPTPTAEAAARFFAALGFQVEWVEDAPGLVLGRIVCQLVNEAAFAIGEGVGSAEDVDAGLTLGLNHPRGPVEWSEAIGLEHVLATIDGLHEERREERYRAAPLLRRAAALDLRLSG